MNSFIENIESFLMEIGANFTKQSPISLQSKFNTFYIFEKKIILQCVDLDYFVKLKIDLSYFTDYVNFAEKEGISVLTIWEDYWYQNPVNLKAILRAKLTSIPYLHGRDTKVERISNPELVVFLQKNHMSTPIPGKYKFGLRHKSGELVAVASFSYARKIQRNQKVYKSYELLRFCNRKDIRVHGGFDKLLKAFVETVQPDDIMTYADREFSAGKVYEKTHFELVEMTSPQEFLLNPETFERFYSNKLPADVDSQKLIRIFNAGNRKYIRLFK